MRKTSIEGLILFGLTAVAIALAASWFGGGADPSAQSGLRAIGGGFDTSRCLIPAKEIRSGGPGKDGIPALTNPRTTSAASARFMRDGDRVIGVAVGEKARAYPLKILVWHEVANDRIGKKSVLVTYCPLCDSVAVFDRMVGGKVIEFGVSGLLYNSNILLFDRRGGGRESLWSQLQMRAVCGPAAAKGEKLNPLPSRLTTWGQWKKEYPKSDVLSVKTGHLRDYDTSPYKGYFATERLYFPVNPAPDPSQGLRNKDRVVAVVADGRVRLYPIRRVAEAAGSGGALEDALGSVRFRLVHDPQADSLRVEAIRADQAPPPAVYSFWFALGAMFPNAEVWAKR